MATEEAYSRKERIGMYFLYVPLCFVSYVFTRYEKELYTVLAPTLILYWLLFFRVFGHYKLGILTTMALITIGITAVIAMIYIGLVMLLPIGLFSKGPDMIVPILFLFYAGYFVFPIVPLFIGEAVVCGYKRIKRRMALED